MTSLSATKDAIIGARVPLITHVTHTELPDGAEVINDYRIIQTIGEGGYAVVDLAEHMQTNAQVAIKRMSKRSLSKVRDFIMPARGGSGDGGGSLARPRVVTALDKVRREISIHTHCKHPNIVDIIAIIDDPSDDELLVVLEYCRNGQIMTFDNELLIYTPNPILPTNQCGGIAESFIRQVVRSLISAFEYLHDRRIIHRDVKPENILLTDTNVVKLIDFGVARQFSGDESHLISETHGTYHFFSPEMCTGSKYSGFHADVWAIGVTVFVLATGRVPFMSDNNNVPKLFEMIGECVIVWPKPADTVLSSRFRSFIEAILTRDAESRLTLSQVKEHPFMKDSDEETKTH